MRVDFFIPVGYKVIVSGQTHLVVGYHKSADMPTHQAKHTLAEPE